MTKAAEPATLQGNRQSPRLLCKSMRMPGLVALQYAGSHGEQKLLAGSIRIQQPACCIQQVASQTLISQQLCSCSILGHLQDIQAM